MVMDMTPISLKNIQKKKKRKTLKNGMNMKKNTQKILFKK